MPVEQTPDGGYRYGPTGKVYYGNDAKEKAEKQGRTIEHARSNNHLSVAKGDRLPRPKKPKKPKYLY